MCQAGSVSDASSGLEKFPWKFPQSSPIHGASRLSNLHDPLRVDAAGRAALYIISLHQICNLA
jgi:hypothetical protein